MLTSFTTQQLDSLRCPFSGSRLLPISDRLLQCLHRQADRGELRDRLGRVITCSLDGGLANADRTFCYPVIAGTVHMLRNEVIPLDQIRDELGELE